MGYASGYGHGFGYRLRRQFDPDDIERPDTFDQFGPDEIEQLDSFDARGSIFSAPPGLEGYAGTSDRDYKRD